MPNPKYIKGRRKEYKTVNDEKSLHRIAQRTAGSHSPFDVISIDSHIRVIRLIQCKPTTMPQNEISRLLEQNKALNGYYKVIFEIR